MTSSCPACGHNILNHKKGQCLVIVTLKGGREPIKGHCGCTHIQPITAKQLTFKGIALDFDRH